MTKRILPGPIAAALMTQRPSLLHVVAEDVRKGTLALSPEDQAEVIELLGDFLQQANEDRQLTQETSAMKQCMSRDCNGYATYKVAWDADDGYFTYTYQCEVCHQAIIDEGLMEDTVAFTRPLQD